MEVDRIVLDSAQDIWPRSYQPSHARYDVKFTQSGIEVRFVFNEHGLILHVLPFKAFSLLPFNVSELRIQLTVECGMSGFPAGCAMSLLYSAANLSHIHCLSFNLFLC